MTTMASVKKNILILFKSNALHYTLLCLFKCALHIILHYFGKCNALQSITHYHYPRPGPKHCGLGLATRTVEVCGSDEWQIDPNEG